MKIYKYNLTDGIVEAPIMEILDIQLQQGVPVMWALVNEGAHNKRIEVKLFWTGQEVSPNDLKEFEYFRTLQDVMGLVWHIFIKQQ